MARASCIWLPLVICLSSDFLASAQHQSRHSLLAKEGEDFQSAPALKATSKVQEKSDDEEEKTLGPVEPLAATGQLPPGNASEARALQMLDVIYQGHSLHAFWQIHDYTSAHNVMAAAGLPGGAGIYGEVSPATLLEILKKAGAMHPGLKYYDLGSGTGKSAMAAWLFGLNATGVELIGSRHEVACAAVERAKSIGVKTRRKGPSVRFLHKNFLNLDLSDADVVFADSVTFSDSMLQGLAQAALAMQPHSKIITTKGLPGPGFLYVDKVSGPTSWSAAASWIIQERDHSPNPKDVSSDGSLSLAVQRGSIVRSQPPKKQMEKLQKASKASKEECSLATAASGTTAKVAAKPPLVKKKL